MPAQPFQNLIGRHSTRAREWNDGRSNSGMAGRASDRGSPGLAGSGRPQLDGPPGRQAKSGPVAADSATAGKGGPASERDFPAIPGRTHPAGMVLDSRGSFERSARIAGKAGIYDR